MGPGSRSLCSLVRDDDIDSIFKQPILRPVIASASEAIHRAAPKKNGCFVALLLAMTSHLRDLAARYARALL
jgi:hypothetical protein